jgi:hypothetical protein
LIAFDYEEVRVDGRKLRRLHDVAYLFASGPPAGEAAHDRLDVRRACSKSRARARPPTRARVREAMLTIRGES